MADKYDKEFLEEIGNATIQAVKDAVYFAKRLSDEEWVAERDGTIQIMEKLVGVVEAQHVKMLELLD